MSSVILVPHTHWDRAWYLPFESYRHRLVRFVDQLLEVLEHNPDFSSFTLDGQTVLLDDYFEIRPENKSRLEALVRAKRIEIGPWYTLPDLFLSSGESLIRNLEMGLSHAESFGGGMKVGYVPDPFGHPAELVQILAGFQIESFIFMRGMSNSVKKEFGSHFNWQSASRVEVLAVYQPGGYLDASALGFPEQWGRNEGLKPQLNLALERVSQNLATMEKFQQEKIFLLSNGCDHMPVQENLPEIVAGLREKGVDIKIGTFSEYIDGVKSENLIHGSYAGDLLGNADHPILSSVWSTHIKLKLLNRECEKILTRYLEPLQVFFAGVGPDQAEFTKSAWKKLLKNQAHDDICGCSHDEVHAEDQARFHRIKRLAEGLIREKLEHYLMSAGNLMRSEQLHSKVFLFNPHPFEVQQTLRLKILMPNPNGEFAAPTPEKKLRAVDNSGQILDVKVLETKAMDIRNHFLETTWGRSYTITFDVSLKPFERKILVIEEVASESLNNSHSVENSSVNDHHSQASQLPSSGSSEGAFGVSSGKSLKTSLVLNKYGWTLNAQNSLELFSPSSKRGLFDFLSFEWEEDNGDTYSASIKPNSKIRSKFLRSLGSQEGIAALFELELPSRTSPSTQDLESASINQKKMPIRVDFSIDATFGVTARVCYDNHTPNGRLRMIVHPGFEATASEADGHFRLVPHQPTPLAESDHAPRAYPGELTYDTKHMGEFVFVEGQDKVWVGARGHAEYELTKAGLAITLHRSVGMLSVGGGRLRGCQAGPSIPTPAAQCLGAHEHFFAIGFGEIDRLAMIQSLRLFSTPVYAVEAPYLRYLDKAQMEDKTQSNSSTSRSSSNQQASMINNSAQTPKLNSGHHSELVVSDPKIVLSSFRHRGLHKEIRLYNQTTEKCQTTIELYDVEKLEKVSLDHGKLIEVIEPRRAEIGYSENNFSALSLSKNHRKFSLTFKPSEIITLRYS